MTDEPKVISLPLAKIVRDEDLQMRDETNWDHIESIKESMTEGVKLPPVKVWQEKTESGILYFLADGHHRYQAHELLGKKEILCEVHSGGREAALDHSYGANYKNNSLRRTTKDKQKAVARCCKHHPELSQRKIGKLCKVSHMMVKRHLDNLKKCNNVTLSDDSDCNNVTPTDPQTDFFNALETPFKGMRKLFEELLNNTGFTDDALPVDAKIKALGDVETNIKLMLRDVKERKAKLAI